MQKLELIKAIIDLHKTLSEEVVDCPWCFGEISFLNEKHLGDENNPDEENQGDCFWIQFCKEYKVEIEEYAKKK